MIGPVALCSKWSLKKVKDKLAGIEETNNDFPLTEDNEEVMTQEHSQQ